MFFPSKICQLKKWIKNLIWTPSLIFYNWCTDAMWRPDGCDWDFGNIFPASSLQDVVTFLSRTEAGGGNGKQYAVSEEGREGSLAAQRGMKKFSWPGS